MPCERFNEKEGIETRRSMDKKLVRELEEALGKDAVLWKTEDLMLYEYDGSVEQARPEYVVFPRSTRDVVQIMLLANRFQVPLVGRGAGTGLSGGAVPPPAGIFLVFFPMNRTLRNTSKIPPWRARGPPQNPGPPAPAPQTCRA